MKMVVIGSGISGLNFALRAAEENHRITIITKKKLSETSTNLAQGGIAAVLRDTDDYKKHVEDTLKAGCYHNKKSAVEFMIRHGPAAIERLLELGVNFASRKGKLLLTREGGHSERRIAFVGDYTGQEIEKTLVKKARRNPNITILEHTFAIDLLVQKGTCYGVSIFTHGKIKNLFADITVLATGGLGQVFQYTTNPLISTGDGYAMAFRAGAKIRDMEFIQFHPTAFLNPGQRLFLLSEALRGEGAYLRDSREKRFMLKKHPLKELAPRDIVSRAVFEAMQHGPVYLDMRHKNPHHTKTRFPKIYQTLKKYGYDLTKNLIPITPAAHYCCGGIVTNFHGQTNIKNLFAFGEVAWTGAHGANRLASNSLLEALVFSDQIISKIKSLSLEKMHFLLPKKNNLSSFLKDQIKKTMWDCVSLHRTKKGLQQAKQILTSVLAHPLDWETKNMAQTSLLIVEASLRRKQSLGCHSYHEFQPEDSSAAQISLHHS